MRIPDQKNITYLQNETAPKSRILKMPIASKSAADAISSRKMKCTSRYDSSWHVITQFLQSSIYFVNLIEIPYLQCLRIVTGPDNVLRPRLPHGLSAPVPRRGPYWVSAVHGHLHKVLPPIFLVRSQRLDYMKDFAYNILSEEYECK